MECAIVGAGAVAREYVADIETTPLTVTAVVDTDATAADTLATQVGATGYTDLDRCLTAEGAPLVINLTPHRVHADVTAAAIDAGRHVFSEKPLALEPAVATDLVDRAAAAGVGLAAAPIAAVFADDRETTNGDWRFQFNCATSSEVNRWTRVVTRLQRESASGKGKCTIEREFTVVNDRDGVRRLCRVKRGGQRLEVRRGVGCNCVRLRVERFGSEVVKVDFRRPVVVPVENTNAVPVCSRAPCRVD